MTERNALLLSEETRGSPCLTELRVRRSAWSFPADRSSVLPQELITTFSQTSGSNKKTIRNTDKKKKPRLLKKRKTNTEGKREQLFFSSSSFLFLSFFLFFCAPGSILRFSRLFFFFSASFASNCSVCSPNFVEIL